MACPLNDDSKSSAYYNAIKLSSQQHHYINTDTTNLGQNATIQPLPTSLTQITEAHETAIGMQCTKMTYALLPVDESNETIKLKRYKLEEELTTRTLNPVLICFTPIHKVSAAVTLSQPSTMIWNNTSTEYQASNIKIHFTAEAKMITTESGATVYTTSSDIVNETKANILSDESRDYHYYQMGLGFIDSNGDNRAEIFIVFESSKMYFDNDCLTHGTVDVQNNYASMFLHETDSVVQFEGSIVAVPINYDL